MTTTEVRYDRLLPAEFDARLATAPVAYVPVGSLEWHSAHLPYGVDTDKATAICERAAAAHGGIVLPGSPWGFMQGSWRGATHPGLRPETIFNLYADVLRGLSTVGFKAAIVVSGHWTTKQTIPISCALEQVRHETGLRGLVTFDGSDDDCGFDPELGLDMDHAGALETSVYGALFPENVHLDRLSALDLSDLPGEECHLTRSGIQGRNPQHATDFERGRWHVDEVVKLLGEAAARLLS
ncbi:creatininase family protein [Saccharopolyspora hirsuta]|uniref:Creatininase family protein n=1 Tax=Saccharopolyspora hirsuta TaxID=1837 RepID=A0A5M7C0X0_SACHI|nr:creatininase family protein [Saccharopolyspora hirsuta]KAA5835070.1 creatininase family protein [Saccharopolyspora hirsuta]